MTDKELVWTVDDQNITWKRGWALSGRGGFRMHYPSGSNKSAGFLGIRNIRCFNHQDVSHEPITQIVEEALLLQDVQAIKALILLCRHNPEEYGIWSATAEALKEVYETI